ncbi:MAG: hypothetical protein ACPG4T_23140, partial [Nannocystaceae bacterium]
SRVLDFDTLAACQLCASSTFRTFISVVRGKPAIGGGGVGFLVDMILGDGRGGISIRRNFGRF